MCPVFWVHIKIKFYKYLKNTDNIDCHQALKKFVSKYDEDKILKVINDTPQITDIHKEFMYKILDSRYEKIIMFSLENNININKSL